MSGTSTTHRIGQTFAPEQEASWEEIQALFENNASAITCVHRTKEDYPTGSGYDDQYGMVCIHDDVTAELTLQIATVDEGDAFPDLRPSLIYFMCRRKPNDVSDVYTCYKNGVVREQFNFVGNTVKRLRTNSDIIEVKSWDTLNSMRDASMSIEGMADFPTIEYYESVRARTQNTHDHLAEALGARQCLNRLSLFPTPESRITERFLTDLSMHTRLTELAVHHFEDFYQTNVTHYEMVAQMLRTGTSIQHLLLHGYEVRGDQQNCLFDALQHGNSNVTKISLVGCHFFQGAEVGLIRFVQSIAPQRSSLRELHLECNEHMFGLDLTIGKAVGEMLTGSGLDAISLVGPATVLDLAGLCKTMTTKADLMKFTQLTLWDCGGGISSLSRCLPHLSNLRTLIWYDTLEPRSPSDLYGVKVKGIEESGHDHGSRNFSEAIRRSGSLTTITVEPKGRMDYFATLDYNKIQMYCQRNEKLPNMLKTRPFLLLVPMLFAAAKQVDKTAHTTLLLSLLSMPTDLRGSTATTAKGKKRSRCTMS